MKNFLKKTPIHCVVKISGTGATTETIDISSDLVVAPEAPTTPTVDISAIHVSVPVGDATITRGGQQLWKLNGLYSLHFNGFSDNVQSDEDIVVVLPAGGGTVVVELKKTGGYGDEQHRNPLS